MGNGASAGLAAGVSAATSPDLKLAMSGLTPDTRAKLRDALKTPRKDVQTDESATCVSRVQAALDAIAAKEPRLNACIEVLNESALKQAAEADKRLADGAPRRAFEGVPLLVKGNIDVEGTLSTAGWRGLDGWRPETTAPVAKRLIEAGAIVVAKTTLPEAAFGLWGWSSLHGLTVNPHNDRYSAGGSSTGSAVGIAAGYAAVALGSDTEGSLRAPAEFAGVVGMRPTLGRYPEEGIVPCNIAHDTAGPMGATVADVAALDATIMGTPLSEYQPADLSSVTVALPPDWAALAQAAPGSARALELVVAALSSAGATVKKEAAPFAALLTPPEGHEELSFREEGLDKYIASHPKIGRTTDHVVEASFYPNVRNFYKDPKNLAGPLINMKTKQGTDEYTGLKAKYDKEIGEMKERYLSYMADHGADVILTPCCAGPPNLAKTAEEYNDNASFLPLIMGAMAVYKPIMGLNGVAIPSIAMPTPARHEAADIGSGGALPSGVLLWGRPDGDKRMIEVAMALEKALQA